MVILNWNPFRIRNCKDYFLFIFVENIYIWIGKNCKYWFRGFWDTLKEEGQIEAQDVREKAEILVDNKYGKYGGFEKLGKRIKEFFKLEGVGENGSQKFWRPKDWKLLQFSVWVISFPFRKTDTRGCVTSLVVQTSD